MPGPRRDENGVTGRHGTGFAVDFHEALAFENKVELLAFPVVVAFGGAPRRDLRLGEALVFDRRIRPVKNASDPGAVFCRKRFLAG